MITVRTVMSGGTQGVLTTDTLASAARLMRDLDVDVLPVRAPDRSLRGLVTDRDIVVGCVAADLDPAITPVARMASRPPVTVEAGDSVEQVLAVMTMYGVRRLPVTEGPAGDLVGSVSQADIARCLSDVSAGELAAAIGAAPHVG